jgi:AcrR family transcriptional regulator
MNKRSGKESKKRILTAATRVFSAYGYKGASMRMIAQAADISLGGLYLYFKNKEDLYTTLIRIRLNKLTEETRKVLRGVDDPAGAIRTFITMRVNYAKKHRELILLLGKEQGFTFGIRARKQFFREQRRVVEEIVRKGIASGRMRKCNVEEVAKVIICALRGFIISMLVEPDALFSAEECSTLVLEGLRVNNHGPLFSRR